jgi:thiol-disulfide isomerase/thioredoxin
MSQGAWVLLAALVAATAFGVFRAARDGRFRGTHALPASSPAPDQAYDAGALDTPGPGPAQGSASGVGQDLGLDLGERATLLQFSSAFCAPCRTTRRVLAEVADLVPGVRHVEVDAEQHLDVVRRLGILRTPTTLVLDAQGRELTRATGAPKRDEVLATLAQSLPD